MRATTPPARPVAGQYGPPGFRGLVRYEVSETTDPAHRPPHRGLPSSSLTVVFATDSPILCSPDYDSWAGQKGDSHKVCIGSFHTRPVYLHRPDYQEGLQLSLHPLSARRLLGLPASALTELTQEGENVLGSRVRELASRVGSAEPGERKRLVVQAFHVFARQHDRDPGPRPEVVGAWRLLERSGGRMRIRDVASTVGVSSRHLSTLVTAELGIGTKQLADLLRFRSAHAGLVGALSRSDGANLADIAHAHGYYDHAHLDRAYRRFADTSPTGWIAEEFRNIQDRTPVPGSHSTT